MKRTLQLVSAIAVSSILSSCGGGGDSISEVKLIPVQSGYEFQYIDKEGKIVINPQFKNATVFRDGLALVETSGDEPKFGFITEDGKYAINAQYKEATVFSDGLAWVVTENAAPTAIDKKGEIKFTLQDAEEVRLFKNGLAAFSMVNEEGEEKWGFVNKEGKVVINPQFSSVSNFSDGKCGVGNSDGKWGFIDKEGKISINYQFDGTGDFRNGKCIVTFDNKDGVIDKEGKYIINPQFSNMQIDGDLFLVNQDGKWGWCDKDGKFVINPQFEEAYPFNGNKTTSVQSGRSYGYIDKEGNIVINPQFDVALPFNGKLALVVSGEKIGFIDKKGKYVINPQFDGVSKDLVMFMLNGGSKFESVETDFFNITSIVNRVNVNTPEGLLLSSKLYDVVTKLKITENEFSKYSTKHMVIQNEKLTNDASFSFRVIANAYKKIPDGWYTKKVFNPDAEVQGYAYDISLTGKGFGKAEKVFEAIEKTLTGYERSNNGYFDIYKNDKQVISIGWDGNEVWLKIDKIEYYEEYRD